MFLKNVDLVLFIIDIVYIINLTWEVYRIGVGKDKLRGRIKILRTIFDRNSNITIYAHRNSIYLRVRYIRRSNQNRWTNQSTECNWIVQVSIRKLEDYSAVDTSYALMRTHVDVYVYHCTGPLRGLLFQRRNVYGVCTRVLYNGIKRRREKLTYQPRHGILPKPTRTPKCGPFSSVDVCTGRE